MPGHESATVRVRFWRNGRPVTAGLGMLVGPRQVVTCAHVVNTTLDRGQDEQAQPDESDVVQVEFPLLPGPQRFGGPVRDARVVAWQPPRGARAGGGDVAGLELAEKAPAGATPARFMAAIPTAGTRLRVFGYPSDPYRPGGHFVEVEVMGQVSGQMLQVQSDPGQTVRVQPGYSGSPVWNDDAGEAAGLLQLAPSRDESGHDALLLPPAAIAAAWEEQFGYLLELQNPYRGLEPFTADHASVFFGRGDDIDALTGKVDAQPVTVVVGPSGVGKSSLVQAGLIPRLGESWSVVLVLPGQDPWLRLAAGMLRARNGPQAQPTEAESREEIGRLRAEGLGPAAEFLRSRKSRLLVVVDQFEEVLATGPPEQALLDLLLPQPGREVQAARVVVTLRADYLPVLQSIPGLHRRLNDRLHLLSPLAGQQISDAVRLPADARGVSFEPGLADQIVADAADGALPVLEFTLTQLWHAQHNKTLTFAGYREMGGVRGALNQFADQQVAQLGDTAGEQLDSVLLRLVNVPVGGLKLATRQRVRKSQVPEAEWEVLERLAAARLVVQDVDPDGDPYAELAHETLIIAWQRLSELVAANSEFLTWLARMEQRAADNDFLPEGWISQAKHWVRTRPGDIPDHITAFIIQSETLIEDRGRQAREQEAREQEEATRLPPDVSTGGTVSLPVVGSRHTGGATSGVPDAGAPDAGATLGGAALGAPDAGGASTGGTTSGGANAGCANGGGAASGGANAVGASTGGSNTGGTTSGSANGGGAFTGGTNTGGDPSHVPPPRIGRGCVVLIVLGTLAGLGLLIAYLLGAFSTSSSHTGSIGPTSTPASSSAQPPTSQSATPTTGPTHSTPPSPIKCDSGSLHLIGSTAFGPFARKAADAYMADCPHFSISITVNNDDPNYDGDSAFGISQTKLAQGDPFLAGSTIAMYDGSPTASYTAPLKPYPGVGVVIFSIIAHDGTFAGSSISPDKLRDIFAGPDVGGYIAIGRNYGSGSRWNLLMSLGKDPAKTPVAQPCTAPAGQPVSVSCTAGSTAAALSIVNSTRHSVSYAEVYGTTLAGDLQTSVIGINGFMPTTTNVLNGNYGYVAVEHLYTGPNPKPLTNDFISFLRQYIASNTPDGLIACSAATTIVESDCS